MGATAEMKTTTEIGGREILNCRRMKSLAPRYLLRRRVLCGATRAYEGLHIPHALARCRKRGRAEMYANSVPWTILEYIVCGTQGHLRLQTAANGCGGRLGRLGPSTRRKGNLVCLNG